MAERRSQGGRRIPMSAKESSRNPDPDPPSNHQGESGPAQGAQEAQGAHGAQGTQEAKEAQGAQEALLRRPELSIRTRVGFIFLLMFVLCSGMTVAAVKAISSFEARITFLEDAGSFSSQIEEARRNEKNYFLYGTGLPEALAAAHLARDYLQHDSSRFQLTGGSGRFMRIQGDIEVYEGLLNRLVSANSGNEPLEGTGVPEIEAQLRTTGAQLLHDAQDMIRGEREAVSTMLHTARLSAFAFLAFLLLVLVLFGAFVAQAFLKPLNRFVEYVERASAGDYQPITPIRRYRDEYSRLALAFNRMLAEILTRQEQLVQSGKMAAIGTLTSGIAHELNNPLNNISLNIEALADDPASYSVEQQQRMLDQVATQVERASAIVRNLLDFTRKGRTVFGSVTLKDILPATLRLVANEAKLCEVECSLDPGGDLPPILGNPQHLKQVFLNLFLNAIQAMPEGGSLQISAIPGEEGWIRVDVKDTGLGIRPDHLEQIFDPFYTSKAPGIGTGLGLSVSRSIIEEHGGRIEVASMPGEGTVFSVFLPVETRGQSLPPDPG